MRWQSFTCPLFFFYLFFIFVVPQLTLSLSLSLSSIVKMLVVMRPPISRTPYYHRERLWALCSCSCRNLTILIFFRVVACQFCHPYIPLRVSLDTTYFAKNWKHYSKIIFKCVKNTVHFFFLFICLGGLFISHEQCTRCCS